MFENPLADLIKRPEGYVIADTDLPVIVPNEGYECLGWDPDPIGTQVTGHTSFTAKYGVSMKPYSLTLAYVAKDVINPIDGPSGVSIGHIRP